MNSTNRVSGTGWRDGDLERLMAWHASTGRGFDDFIGLKTWIEKQPSETRRQFLDLGWEFAAEMCRRSELARFRIGLM